MEGRFNVPGAAEPYDEGWESVEPHQKKALAAETHPKVKEALEKALQRR